MQNMQEPQGGSAASASSGLLTADQVQALLDVDRSTIYRMASDGRLPAVKIGRQWRFPADRIRTLLEVGFSPDGRAAAPSNATPSNATPPSTAPSSTAPSPTTPSAAPSSTAPSNTTPSTAPSNTTPSQSTPSTTPSHTAPADTAPPASKPSAAGHHPVLSSGIVEPVLDVAAEVLGVMMVVTDMQGQPVSHIANPAPRMAAAADDPDTIAACTAEWRAMADDLDFEPRFNQGPLGFECARAFIRAGTSLIGMVLAGGISPAGTDADDLYDLPPDRRAQVLASLPKVAAALSRAAARTDDPGRATVAVLPQRRSDR